MKWLEDNFGYLDDTSNALEKEKHARAFILKLVNDVLMPDKSQNLVHLRWLLKLVDLKETDRLILGMVSTIIFTSLSRHPLYFPTRNKRKSCRTTRGARRYPILLDQQSKTDFEWMSYTNLRIRACIPAEYLANPKIWHMKVPLIVYAKVEMHESDRVDLRGRIDEDWPTFHGQYINIWQPLSTTCHGLDIMTNHIFYLRRQGLGNVILGGQDYKTPNPYPSPE
ncbi:hypothetical protein Goshw_001546 [Gossypium schwendimanii]|uniref:Uncharacterized protein n=1 Tax=Gossypium schwendimanii TaxID=34291 RepID=A0A7J9MQW2_GOSSC|nr:hypothetical protein [Gossypium schwendimanii]